MLPSKIGLTEQIINKIKAARIAKRFPAATLSKAIKRDNSYISSLELGRLRTISSFDLIAIFCALYSIPEQEAVAMIEQLLCANTPSNDSMIVNEPEKNYTVSVIHTVNEKPELIGDMLETMTGLLINSYKSNPKEAVFALKCFIETMQVDLAFATEIMSIPFYTLKSLSIDEQKEVLSKLIEIIKDYSSTS